MKLSGPRKHSPDCGQRATKRGVEQRPASSHAPASNRLPERQRRRGARPWRAPGRARASRRLCSAAPWRHLGAASRRRRECLRLGGNFCARSASHPTCSVSEARDGPQAQASPVRRRARPYAARALSADGGGLQPARRWPTRRRARCTRPGPLGARSRLDGIDVETLLSLWTPCAAVPDFLTPPPLTGSPQLDEELERRARDPARADPA